MEQAFAVLVGSALENAEVATGIERQGHEWIPTFCCKDKNYCGKDLDVTNHQPTDPATDETSHVTIPATRSECANPVEAALWRALREARRERDEARRLVCEMQVAKEQGTPEGWAREWGWDCYEEKAK